jgi:hypothetical protein
VPVAAEKQAVVLKMPEARYWGDGTVVFGEGGAITTEPNAIVEVDVQRLDTDQSGAVVLVAQAARRGGVTRAVRLSVKPASSGHGRRDRSDEHRGGAACRHDRGNAAVRAEFLILPLVRWSRPPAGIPGA